MCCVDVLLVLLGDSDLTNAWRRYEANVAWIKSLGASGGRCRAIVGLLSSVRSLSTPAIIKNAHNRFPAHKVTSLSCSFCPNNRIRSNKEKQQICEHKGGGVSERYCSQPPGGESALVTFIFVLQQESGHWKVDWTRLTSGCVVLLTHLTGFTSSLTDRLSGLSVEYLLPGRLTHSVDQRISVLMTTGVSVRCWTCSGRTSWSQFCRMTNLPPSQIQQHRLQISLYVLSNCSIKNSFSFHVVSWESLLWTKQQHNSGGEEWHKSSICLFKTASPLKDWY